jgi:hypothetical protein
MVTMARITGNYDGSLYAEYSTRRYSVNIPAAKLDLIPEIYGMIFETSAYW